MDEESKPRCTSRLSWRMYLHHFKRRLIKLPAAIALLVLSPLMLASFSTLEVVLFIYETNFNSNSSAKALFSNTTNLRVFSSHVNFLFLLPFWLAGLVADVYVGRYKTIVFSAAISLLLLLAASIVTAVGAMTNDDVLSVALGLTCASLVTLAPFYATVVQFGTDQLRDASSDEVSAFIHWYVWTYFLGSLPLSFAHVLLIEFDHYKILLLVVALCVAMVTLVLGSLVALHIAGRLSIAFVHDPPTAKPYRDILGVLSFARRHTAPIRRSAFTYWEESIPSRVDLCKSKYGGPYSSETVEEVKTIGHVLPILFCFSLGCYCYVSALPNEYFLFHVGALNANDTLDQVATVFAVSPIYGVILVPILEVVMYPLFGNRLKMHTKFRVGLFLCIISIIINLLIDAVGHLISNDSSCMFNDNKTLIGVININPFVLTLPGCLAMISITIMFISGLELSIAQAPQTMKGVLIGFTYCMVGLFALIGIAVTFVFNKSPSDYYSCCSLYYTINSVLGMAVLCFFSVAVWRYKMRLKDDCVLEYDIIQDHYDRFRR